MSNKKHECCTPEGQVPRYVDCIGCDKKPIEGATLSYAQAQKDSFNIMEKKQSSIEWLAEQRLQGVNLDDALEQAKAMHKEEIKEAVKYGCSDWGSAKDSDQYYNETYGGQDEH